MPSPEEILAGLSEIAHRFWYVAVAWHLIIASAMIAALVGWRPSARTTALLMAPPLFSVGLLAFLTHNPFNGTAFLVIGLACVALARGFATVSVHVGTRWQVLVGAAMVAFGWFYPHFVDARSVLTHVFGAPTGLVPCPTLSVVIGFGVMFRGFNSRRWSAMIAVAGLFYGIVGAFRLGVSIDLLLDIGALALLVVAFDPHAGAASRLDPDVHTKTMAQP